MNEQQLARHKQLQAIERQFEIVKQAVLDGENTEEIIERLLDLIVSLKINTS